MKKVQTLILSITLTISACASPHVMQISKPTDHMLSCDQIIAELTEAEDFKRKALKEKGVTGTNAAAFLFFWPAIFATYGNIDDAVDAADARIKNMNTHFNNMKCGTKEASG